MTQISRIMRAIVTGAQTSSEIADEIGAHRRNVSVALHRLAESGLVERAGVVNVERIGRPHVRWRLRSSPKRDESFARAPSNLAPAE